MSGQDKKYNNPLNLMSKRLGVFYQQPTGTTIDYTEGIKNERSLMARRMGLLYNGASVNEKTLNDDTINTDSDVNLAPLDGLDNQLSMLEFNGGHLQQERMIYDKRRSLDRAVLYSYQAADVKKVNADKDEKPIRALINPNKLKQDYDDKVISIGYEYGYQPGDVFNWVGTNTFWLIYSQNLTELAYFRGDIRRCSYKISIPGVDSEGNIVAKEIYAAIIGPQQSNIQTTNYDGISHDMLNNTITLLVPKNEATVAFFNRRLSNNNEVYDKFALRPIHENLNWLTYHVENADWISTPGVIQVTALEVKGGDFDKDGLFIPDTSDIVEQKVEDFNNQEIEEIIEGDTFIKPIMTSTYYYHGNEVGKFVIGGNKAPVKVIEQDDKHIVLKWTHTHSGQFKLIYRVSKWNKKKKKMIDTDTEKVVVVESLF